MDRIIEQSSVVSGQLSVDDDETLTKSGFYWRESGGVKVLVNRALETAGFVNGFSTRLGGVSSFGSEPPASAGGQFGYDLNLAGFDEDSAKNIHENRRRFLATFNDEFDLATAWQIHGDTVKIIRDDKDVKNSEERADAIVCDLGYILVGVKTADCVPMLIGDPATGSFAAVHAGWRGTVQSIVKKTVDKMRETFGSNPSDFICAIGPAASGRSYEVGTDVISAFAKNFENSDKYFVPMREEHALVDLHRANRDQLINAGVREGNIYIAPFCTMERTDLFFSYRIEKKKFGKTGRLLSVIGRASERERSS